MCGLSASAWLVPGDRVTGRASLLLAAGVYGLVALTGLVGVLARRWRGAAFYGDGGRWRLAGAGVGVLAAPLLLFAIAGRLGGGGFAAGALCTAPLWVMVALAAMRGAALDASLMPAMAGLGGALLLLPVAEPGALRAGLGTGLCLLAAAVLGASVAVCAEEMQRGRAAEAVLVAAGASAVVLAAAGVLLPGQAEEAMFGWAMWPQVLLALATAGLGTVLLRALPARVYATQFLWTPLLTVIEGYVVVRPALTLRTVAGVTLLAVGAGVLTWGGEGSGDEGLSLR